MFSISVFLCSTSETKTIKIINIHSGNTIATVAKSKIDDVFTYQFKIFHEVVKITNSSIYIKIRSLTLKMFHETFKFITDETFYYNCEKYLRNQNIYLQIKKFINFPIMLGNDISIDWEEMWVSSIDKKQIFKLGFMVQNVEQKIRSQFGEYVKKIF